MPPPRAFTALHTILCPTSPISLKEIGRSWRGLSFWGKLDELLADQPLLEPVARIKEDAVLNGSPAAAAGVSVGDRLVAIDGTRCDSARLETLLQRHAPGDALRVTVFRGDQLREFSMTLVEPPTDTAWLARDDAADAAVRQRFADWLQAPVA